MSILRKDRKRDLFVLNFLIAFISVNIMFLMFLPAISSYAVLKHDQMMEKDLIIYKMAYEEYKKENKEEKFEIEKYNTYLPKGYSFEKIYSEKNSPYGKPYEIIVNKHGELEIKTNNKVIYSKFYGKK